MLEHMKDKFVSLLDMQEYRSFIFMTPIILNLKASGGE